MGLDILRNKRMWDVLRSRAHDEGCTVLVFSHNVSDTRHADRVGFLRAGRLLAEGSPRELCGQYNCRSLDAVFTSLCLQDDQSFLPIVRKMDQKAVSSTALFAEAGDANFQHFEAVSESTSDSDGDGAEDLGGEGGKPRSSELKPLRGGGGGGVGAAGKRRAEGGPSFEERGESEWRGWAHVPAVLARHLHSLRRSWLLLLFQMAVPTLLAIMFLVFVGHAPIMLNVAVVNLDSGPLGARLAAIVNYTETLETRFYSSLAEARATITQPDGMLAIMVIPANFTVALNALMASPATQAASFVNVDLYLDYGDYQVSNVVEDKLDRGLQSLLQEVYGTSMRLYDAKAIYGSSETQYGSKEKKRYPFFVF